MCWGLGTQENTKKKNDQVAVASKDPPKTVIAEAPRKASKRKRSKSPEPETLREKNELSQKEVLAIHNHDEAVSKGSCLIQYKTENKWKMALGKRKEPYQDQMALRTLKWNASYTISWMINAYFFSIWQEIENNYVTI